MFHRKNTRQIWEQARLKVLPNTETCVKCSDCKPIYGFTSWDKSTPELIIVDKENAERLKHLEKVDGRLGRLK